MTRSWIFVFVFLILVFVAIPRADAQTTEITYQGQLQKRVESLALARAVINQQLRYFSACRHFLRPQIGFYTRILHAFTVEVEIFSPVPDGVCPHSRRYQYREEFFFTQSRSGRLNCSKRYKRLSPAQVNLAIVKV